MINEKLLEPIIGDLKNLNTNQKENLISAINELSNNTKWKLFQSGVQYNTNLSLAEIEFEELYIEVSISETGINLNANIITFVIPKKTLSNEAKQFRNGFFYFDDFNGSVVLVATTENIKFTDAFLKKGQKNSNARMSVWYR